MRRYSELSLVFAVFAIACNSESQKEAPTASSTSGVQRVDPATSPAAPLGSAIPATPLEDVIVTPLPHDNSSNLGDSFLPEIVIEAGGAPLSLADPRVAELISAAEIVEWSGRVKVAGTWSLVPASPQDPRNRLTWRPAGGALSRGTWYAIRLPQVPARAKAATATGAFFPEGAQSFARFRLDSSPRARVMHACVKPDGAISGEIHFSEPVDVLAMEARVSGGSGSCSVVLPQLHANEKGGTFVAARLSFLCTAMGTQPLIRVSARNIRTAGSTSVVGEVLDAQHQLSLDTFAKSPDGCVSIPYGS